LDSFLFLKSSLAPNGQRYILAGVSTVFDGLLKPFSSTVNSFGLQVQARLNIAFVMVSAQKFMRDTDYSYKMFGM